MSEWKFPCPRPTQWLAPYHFSDVALKIDFQANQRTWKVFDRTKFEVKQITAEMYPDEEGGVGG